MNPLEDLQYVVVDRPAEYIARITLNRPESRNALSNDLRRDLFGALEVLDQDESVRVMILCGAGKAFCAGYDLKSDRFAGQPFHTPMGLSNWPRHVVEGSFRIWDLGKPVIAQVHGYCLAGGMELAQSCDLIYLADDAQVGYPPTRSLSPPDNQFFPWILGMRKAMELMLTGKSMSAQEAVDYGFANALFPAAELEKSVLEVAEVVSRTPPDLQQFNKRSVHRQMEAMGIRAALRAATDAQALAEQTESSKNWIASISKGGLTKALSERDVRYGDYRES